MDLVEAKQNLMVECLMMLMELYHAETDTLSQKPRLWRFKSKPQERPSLKTLECQRNGFLNYVTFCVNIFQGNHSFNQFLFLC